MSLTTRSEAGNVEPAILPVRMRSCCLAPDQGQEAASGISVPITISGDARVLPASSAEDGGKGSITAGFRSVLSPTLKLGSHWFVYSALDVHSSKYFTYSTESDENQPVQFELLQAFVGYSTTLSKASLLIKAGQISSAFGLFPIEYDDAKMPLIDAPAMYTSYLPLRPDQLPCGVSDVVRQTYGSEIGYHCGGSGSERYGMSPVTLYGLPASKWRCPSLVSIHVCRSPIVHRPIPTG